MKDNRIWYDHIPTFGRYMDGDYSGRIISEVIGLFGGTCNGDILDIVSERSAGAPTADLKRTILRGARSKLRLGSDEEQLHQDELRWLADIENDVVGTEPSHDPNERWRLRRNALMRRRFGMPSLAFNHDRMMKTFGWCDPAEAFMDDRVMLERADRLTNAAARCAEREGDAIASLLMHDPKGMGHGHVRNIIWECLAEWMDGRNRIPINPIGRLATMMTEPDLDRKWRELVPVKPKLTDAIGNDVAWIMALTRIERILGHDMMPIAYNGILFHDDYDPITLDRAIVGCRDILYDTGIPEGFLRESLLAAMGVPDRERWRYAGGTWNVMN